MAAPTIQPPKPDLGEVLANDSYLRERVAPWLSNANYLSFLDLLDLVRAYASETTGAVFDFGCGGAPYREFFSRAVHYVGADLFPGPRVDKILPSPGLTEELPGSYDALLSTQVLEHVQDPDGYIQECLRILKPGGQVLLSTHGLFQEHGCPWDFHRWTARGLEELFRKHGFQIVKSYKLTAGVRGVLQLCHHLMEELRCDRPFFLRVPFGMYRKCYRAMIIPLGNWIGQRFFPGGLQPGDHPAPIYVGVAVWARKPL